MNSSNTTCNNEFQDHFVIQPAVRFYGKVDFAVNGVGEVGKPVETDFEFHSGRNLWFLSIEEILTFNDLAGV